MENKNKALTVYKASAGSGKTFTLAVEFIKLLIIDPKRYENILAVTFTNKATEEMKHRIVSQLFGISKGLKSSDSYLEKIVAELGYTKELVRERAGIALYNLLHNYNRFRIQTIDAFFQSVLRNMVKELGLGNNMRISLQDSMVISEAVDAMMETLDQNKTLMNWIMQFIDEKMDDGKSWNISTEIKDFGNNLTKEFFKANEHLLADIAGDQSFFAEYKKEMNAILQTTKKKFMDIGNGFDILMNENGVTIDDFAYKSAGVPGYFIKLKNGNYGLEDAKFPPERAKNGMVNASVWGKGRIAELAESVFMPYLQNAEKERQASIRKAKSAKTTLKNLNKMRLLFRIREEMNRLNEQNARFMLSNTQTTLSSMIKAGDSNAPFIYEKIGAYLKHIMIDEFQDTSTVQWENFRILLDNCMSQADTTDTANGNMVHNLIVGDVKQSIYRFRSGDWRLLNNIEEEFTTLTGEETLNTVPLKINWRSERNVIEFNNAFFREAINIEADRIMPENESDQEAFIEANNLSAEVAQLQRDYAAKLRKAYSDVKQDVPESKPERGFVKVDLLTEDVKDEFAEAALERTLNYVKGLVHQHVALSSIAILVRDNKEATRVANYFAENSPEIPIISDQAFMLEASALVMIIVNSMKYLRNEDDIKAKLSLLKLYVSFVLGEDISDDALLTDADSFCRYMPESLCSAQGRQEMLSMSLYELTEHLFQTLSLDRIHGQEPYACAFFDGLKKFLEDNGAILNDFLKYWDEELCHKPISIGSVSSLRVITIHKSKGLEFPHVIMPFTSWLTTTTYGETLWCRTHEEPFSRLPFIPVEYRKRESLDNSIYETYGAEEWMQEIVDNLNLLYVAFTRAGRSLYIIANQDISDNRRTRLLIATLQNMERFNALVGAEYDGISDIRLEKPKKTTSRKAKDSAAEEEPKECSFIFGEHYLEEKPSKENDNVFEVIPTDETVTVHSYDNGSILFRQSNKSREFANDTLDDEDSKRFTTMGSIMHALFSQIHTYDDVEKTLRQFEFDGIIYDETLSPEQLREQLKSKFDIPVVKDWFSDRWTVFNECNIMRIVGGRIVNERPDRVITDGKETIVIDYKFGKEDDRYKEQVRRYMKLIEEMGYPDVHGYIWYVHEDDGIVEVRK